MTFGHPISAPAAARRPGPPPALANLLRLTDLPGVPGGERPAEDLADQLRRTRGALLPALAGAHAAGEAVAVAWLHPAADSELYVLLGGGIAAGGADGSLVYPPGAHGLRLADHQASDLFGALEFWVRCPGGLDALSVDEPHAPVVRPEALFDDYAAALGGTPFGWLVLAEPISRADTATRLTALSRQVPRLRGQAAGAESQRLAHHRAELEYRELARAGALGLWRVHVLAAGAEETQALRVSGLLSAAAEISGLPYLIRAGTVAVSFESVWHAPVEPSEVDAVASPFTASTELLAALARPPVREIRGLRLPPAGDFDITPEATHGLELGTVLDRDGRPAGPFRAARETVNRHVFVCGATGSGKSQTVRALLEALHRDGVPWLVVEPAKAEYAGMAGRIAPDPVLVMRPGDPDAVPAGLNPLEPEPGFPLQTHLDLVRALFLAAFEAEEPFPQVLAQALQRCYETLGWNLVTGGSRLPRAAPRHPTLEDLRAAGLETVARIGYSERVASDVRGFIDVRIKSLQLGSPGRFFAGGHRLDVAGLLRRNAVFELEDIGNDQDKAFLIGTVLIRVAEHLRVRAAREPRGGGLRHVLVVEEAHRLLRATTRDSPAAHAVELFAALLAEVRAYGEGIVVAEQIPSKVAPDLVKNTALKIMHRLPAADDRESVGASMNLGRRRSEYTVTLPPGQAAVFADGMDRPVLVRMPYGEDREDRALACGDPPLAALRAPTCGEHCRMRPCTLREIDGAVQAAGRHAQLALWIEILAVAHVIGRPEPLPRPDWIAGLTQADPRLLDCTIGQLAEAAVERRRSALCVHYRPEDLAVHIAEQARARLRGSSQPCAGDEVQWQAGSYRWTDVAQLLAQYVAETNGKLPHPATDAWLSRGLDLRGHCAADQLVRLLNLPAMRSRDRTALDGVGHPPEHARLAAEIAVGGATEAERFVRATHFLRFQTDWPVRHLCPADAAQNKDG
ncbi:MAG TPA: ATP-binding protein [Actinocrinis sp.]